MANVYTYPVREGTVTELRDFVWQSARAFGPLISMRDAPADAPIPFAFPLDTAYHDQCLAKAEADLAEFEALDPAGRRAAYEAAKAAEAEPDYGEEAPGPVDVVRERYEAMIAKVEAWVPPSPDHQELKAWMLRRLRESLDWDCRPRPPAEPFPAFEAWEARRREHLRWAVDYHAKAIEKTKARVEFNNTWLRLLRESVGDPPRS
jgi:hypothetical protein